MASRLISRLAVLLAPALLPSCVPTLATTSVPHHGCSPMFGTPPPATAEPGQQPPKPKPVTVWGRVRRRFVALPAVVVDTGLALLLIPHSLFSIWLSQPDSAQRVFITFRPIDVAVILATALPVTLRRRFPLIALVVVELATLAQFELLSPWSDARSSFGLLVALAVHGGCLLHPAYVAGGGGPGGGPELPAGGHAP
jgi:hypothetical protein